MSGVSVSQVLSWLGVPGYLFVVLVANTLSSTLIFINATAQVMETFIIRLVSGSQGAHGLLQSFHLLRMPAQGFLCALVWDWLVVSKF